MCKSEGRNNKRCVIFTGTLNEGGAQRVISILSEKLLHRGYELHVLLYYDKEIYYPLHHAIKIGIVDKECERKSMVGRLLWIRDFFKKNADIVLSFLAPFNMLALAANLNTGIPIIVADRNDPKHVPVNPVVRTLRNWMYELADGIVVQTKNNLRYFSSRIQKKSVVIYNPVEMKEKSGLALRTEKNKKIVSVGRLMQQKNQMLLIEAFSDVYQMHPEYELVIYGEGPQRLALEKRIKELRLADCVRLPGSTRNVFDEIANSEIFVLSSDYEGMPNALIEAMCLGIPCISTKVSGAIDLIKDHENGLLVDVNDRKAMKDAMVELIENVELRNKLAVSSLKLNELLATDEIVDKWIRYIIDLKRH